MLISAITDGRGNGSVICERYEEGKYLLIYETDTKRIIKSYSAYEGEPLLFARKTVEHDCEAIVCGVLQKPEFELMSNAGVTRYNGSGLGALIAVRAAVDNELPLFTDFEGGTGCDEHEHDECACGHDSAE